MKYQASKNKHYIMVSSLKVRHGERIIVEAVVRAIFSEKGTKSPGSQTKKDPLVHRAWERVST